MNLSFFLLSLIIKNISSQKIGEGGAGLLALPSSLKALEIMLNEKLYLIWVVLFHDTQPNRAVAVWGRQEGPRSPNFLTANVLFNERL